MKVSTVFLLTSSDGGNVFEVSGSELGLRCARLECSVHYLGHSNDSLFLIATSNEL